MWRRYLGAALSVAAALALGAALLARHARRDPSAAAGRDEVRDGGAVAAARVRGAKRPAAGGPGVVPGYVGTAACASCHAAEVAAWSGSHHDRAMEAPGPGSVEAPFDGRTFTLDGVAVRFDRRGDDYVVRTAGADGEMRDFRVAWTYGVTPLQQYLLDVGRGRLQSLTVAWDARPAAEGGQRFYDLYPEQRLAPDDPLHWTGAMQNWNYVCADCHSTAYRRGYDAERDAFAPRWVEPDVGCEACHGPGGRHVAWAEGGEVGDDVGLVVDLRNGRGWVIAETTHNATPLPETEHVEVDTCAPCHSRRHPIAEGRRPDQPLLDFYRPELLAAPLYHPDGQIDDEVYVYGSFLQSRMFHAGVRCSDCHEPHALTLRAAGDTLCGRCHDLRVYATASHHHHEADGPGAACVDCHMPSKLYMGVDARRDHSMRIPRPDLALALGTPSACASCHAEQGSAWAAEQAAGWWGAARPDHHGPLFAAARRGDPAAFEGLVACSADASRPAIVRGTALRELARYGDAAHAAIAAGAADAAPLVRLGAIHGGQGLSPAPRLAALARLLTDPLRVIRTEAARVLSVVPADRLRDAPAAQLRGAQGELLTAERLYADRFDAWLRIANLELDRGRADEAEAALLRARALAPSATAPRVNLADLARARGDEVAAERWLREALAIDPDDPVALHGLGLLEVRAGRLAQALDYLGRAARGLPDNPSFAYVHVVALWDSGRRDAARTALDEALRRHPFDTALREADRAYARPSR